MTWEEINKKYDKEKANFQLLEQAPKTWRGPFRGIDPQVDTAQAVSPTSDVHPPKADTCASIEKGWGRIMRSTDKLVWLFMMSNGGKYKPLTRKIQSNFPEG
ncbi:MAG: hypothetical protein KKH28_11520 [Elusimicrobia bacterium]|nr:hypothetical protein [Elusimicrobiota bacterium]